MKACIVGLLVVVVVALVYSATTCQAAPGPRFKDFKELLGAARRLESAQDVVSESASKQEQAKSRQQRDELLASFVREPKSSQCEKNFDQVSKVVNEYKLKAYNYVADSKKSNNWFSNLVKLGGPLGGMKNLGKFDGFLNSITERYESQSKSGNLTDDDVDCDMAKFQIKAVESMIFVLQTDIKYLVLEDPQVLNREIKLQLSQDKYVSNNNFYDIEHLTPKQSSLLLDFYTSRIDSSSTSVAEAVQHFHDPGSLIIGRLLDSCHAMLRYKSVWVDVEGERSEVCARSKSDPQNELFASRHKVDKYEDVANFCQQFFDAL